MSYVNIHQIIMEAKTNANVGTTVRGISQDSTDEDLLHVLFISSFFVCRTMTAGWTP